MLNFIVDAANRAEKSQFSDRCEFLHGEPLACRVENEKAMNYHACIWNGCRNTETSEFRVRTKERDNQTRIGSEAGVQRRYCNEHALEAINNGLDVVCVQ